MQATMQELAVVTGQAQPVFEELSELLRTCERDFARRTPDATLDALLRKADELLAPSLAVRTLCPLPARRPGT